MTNKEIRETLKKYGETLITPSIYRGEKRNGKVIFETFDDQGLVYSYFININERYASCQRLSTVAILDSHDVSHMFFN